MARVPFGAAGAAFALLLSACGTGGAQAVPHVPPATKSGWAVQAGGTAESFAVAAENGADGSVVVAGAFTGETVLGRGEPKETTLDAASGQDLFFACYAPDGSLAWAQGAHGTEDAEPMALAAYPDGSFVVAGWFWGDLTFAAGEPLETTLSSGELLDAFLVRFGADGALLWVHQICGSSGGTGHDVALLPDGGVAIAGLCGGPVTFGAGEPTQTTLAFGDGYFEAFVACYDADGSFRWVRGTRSGPASYASAWGVATFADGSIGIAGQFQGTVALAPGGEDEIVLVSAEGSPDAFVARYDATGALTWAHACGSVQWEVVDDAAAGADGTLFVTGTFEHVATFPSSDGLPQALVSRGAKDGYVAAYGPDGDLRWLAQIGGPLPDRASSVAPLPEGGVAVIGCFAVEAYFGAAGEIVLQSHGVGDCEAYVATYAGDGSLDWVRRLGGALDDHGFGIASSPGGGLLVTGCFMDTLYLCDEESADLCLEAVGPLDAFVARLQPDEDR